MIYRRCTPTGHHTQLQWKAEELVYIHLMRFLPVTESLVDSLGVWGLREKVNPTNVSSFPEKPFIGLVVDLRRSFFGGEGGSKLDVSSTPSTFGT